MISKRSRIFRCLSTLLCVTFVSACSLINPHVRWERLQPGHSTLQDGIEYANRAKDEYKKAVGDQAALTNLAGVGLITLGAAALGLGIIGDHRNAITALGVAGAGGFGAATWLSSKPRQLIYIAGIKAMSCAVDAVLPLTFSNEQAAILEKELRELGASIVAVREQIAVVRVLMPKVARASPVLKDAIRDVELAEAALAAAQTTHVAGLQLARERARAGLALMSAVDAIGAEVDRALVATLPDIQTLPSIVGGLAQMAGQFGPVPAPKGTAGKLSDTTTKTATEAGEADALNEAKKKLKEQVADLERHAQYVAAIVSSVGESKPFAALKQCNVEPVSTAISVEPVGPLQFVEGQVANKRLLISGGKPPYIAELDEAPVVGLTVTQPVAFGSRVLIEANKPSEGNYTIRVTDSAGASRTVAIVVDKATGAPPAPGQPPQVAASSPGLTADQQNKVKAALCLPATEVMESARTMEAIKIFQATIKVEVSGQLSPDNIDILVQKGSCKEGRRNYFENDLSANQIRDIRTKLQVTPASGNLDAATRTAVGTFARGKGLKPEDGTLTPEIDKTLKGF